MEPPQLKRGLFGYTPESVHLLLADRDKMFVRASELARTADARVAELEPQLQLLKDELATQTEQLRATETEAADLRIAWETTRQELERTQERLSESDALRQELEASRREVGEQLERARIVEERSAGLETELDRLRRELSSARRESMLEDERARKAEARIEELEGELRSAEEQLEEIRGRIGETPAAPAPVSHGPSTAEELSGVLEAAEQAVARIFDGARMRGEEELHRLERARREVQAEVERLSAWRDRLTPLVGPVQAAIEDARRHTTTLGDRVRETVEPVTATMDTLNERLVALAEVAEHGLQGSAPRLIELRDTDPEGEELSTPPGGRAEDQTTGPQDDPIQRVWR